MANERCGRENMNLQSIVSAVINNLHLMPNSVNRVNSNGSGIVLKMRMLSLVEMHFLYFLNQN
jgi:hypothetical protein